MARRRQQKPKLPMEAITATIEEMTHDGRGVTHIDGKCVFVEGALPGEEVRLRYVEKHRSYDVGVVEEVLLASPDRVEPHCAAFDICGGCSMQHLEAGRQIEVKQKVLLDNLARIGKVTPDEVLPPVTGPHWGYRQKARLGVRHVAKKGGVLVGFREKRAPVLADMHGCEVLHPSVGGLIDPLRELLTACDGRDRIGQIEVAVDDTQTALAFRNLDPLSEADQQRLIAFAQQHALRVYLQPAGPESVVPLWPEAITLHYRHPTFDVGFDFMPSDFTQVNREINQKMVALAIELLALQPEDRVLDLFCGLGNFTLPLARCTREVVGVEGSAVLIERARSNAVANGIDNVAFHVADLSQELSGLAWWKGGVDKVLLDPARIGAEQTLSHIARLGVKRIVYVSCNPATLARDAGILVNDHGYRLEKTGVMDMFPHTAHVESIALFTHK